MSSIPLTAYVYILIDPNTEQVRYVGWTINPRVRLSGHLSQCEKGTSHCCRWVRTLKMTGTPPRMVIIEECTTDNYVERERYWIAHYRNLGVPLTNMSDGGEGMSGKRSAAFRQKMREIALSVGRRIPKPTPEVRERLRQLRRGRTIPDKQKAQISARFKGKPLSDEHREKMRKQRTEWFANSEEGHALAERFARQYASLSDEQVIEILQLIHAGGRTQRSIAAQYGVSASTVSEIKTGKIYKHVKRPEN